MFIDEIISTARIAGGQQEGNAAKNILKEGLRLLAQPTHIAGRDTPEPIYARRDRVRSRTVQATVSKPRIPRL